jgi:putative transposase
VRTDPFIEPERPQITASSACRLLEVPCRLPPAPHWRPLFAGRGRRRDHREDLRDPRESQGHLRVAPVHQSLRRHVSCGRRRVARLMRAAGLEGRPKKRWRTTTIADPAADRAGTSSAATSRRGRAPTGATP